MDTKQPRRIKSITTKHSPLTTFHIRAIGHFCSSLVFACSLTTCKVLQCVFSEAGLLFELSQKGKRFRGFSEYNPPAWEPGSSTRKEVSVFEEVVVIWVPVFTGLEILKDEKHL